MAHAALQLDGFKPSSLASFSNSLRRSIAVNLRKRGWQLSRPRRFDEPELVFAEVEHLAIAKSTDAFGEAEPRRV